MIYLLHFSRPHPRGKHPQHYLGHADDGRFERRIGEHRNGSSKARFTQVMRELGITFEVVRVWPGGYDEERKLKAARHLERLCPTCARTLQRARNITVSANAENPIDTFAHRAYGVHIPKRIREKASGAENRGAASADQ